MNGKPGPASIDFDKYCVRCDSEIGHHPEGARGPDWCWICMEDALRLPPYIRALIESSGTPTGGDQEATQSGELTTSGDSVEGAAADAQEGQYTAWEIIDGG